MGRWVARRGLLAVLLLTLVVAVGPVSTATSAVATPVALSAGPPAVNVLSLGVGRYHSCAVRSDQTVACWGSTTYGNMYGQLNAPAGTFTAVSAGQYHSCALRAVDSTVVCWGSNADGRSTPPSGAFRMVVAGPDDSCGVRQDDGTVACWGQSSGLQTPPAGAFTSVTVGEGYACGLRPDSTITCWGAGVDQFGGRDRVPPTGTFQSVSAGWLHACAVRTDSTVTCWGGDNFFGEASPPAGAFVTVAAGYRSTCGIAVDQTITCWGEQIAGLLAPSPGVFRAVGIETDDGCGIRADDGTVACWGANDDGLLGAAPAVPDPAPAAATVGVPYSHTFTSGTGRPAGSFSVSAGALPAGLTLSADGVISGTPTTRSAAAAPFTVAAWDGVFPTARKEFVIDVMPPPDTTAPTTTIVLTTATPTGSNGWYSGPVTAVVTATDTGNGGAASGVTETRCVLDPATAPATFADLPAGCAYITGAVVSSLGAHTLYAASVDRNGNAEAVRSVSFTVGQVPGAASVSSVSGGDGKAVVSFTPGTPGYPTPVSYTVTASPVTPGQAPTVTTPSGSGSPVTVAGLVDGVAYTFTVTATNATGSATGPTSSPVTIGVPAGISGSAPAGIVGTAYSYSYQVTGMPAPTVTLTSGTLPPGLSLSAAGVLSGTPNANGTSTFTVTATNAVGSAQVTNTVVISTATTPNRADLVAKVTAPPSGRTGQSYTYTVSVKNQGPATAKTVVTSLVIPEGTQLVSATGGPVRVGQAVIWSTGSIGNGATVTYTVTVKPVSKGVRTAYEITGSLLTPDPAPGSNTTKATTTVS